MGDRCVVLDAGSLEAYLPLELYHRAGRDKTKDLDSIEDLRVEAKHNPDGRRKLSAIKREISEAVANVLTSEDRILMPKLFQAVERAAADKAIR